MKISELTENDAIKVSSLKEAKRMPMHCLTIFSFPYYLVISENGLNIHDTGPKGKNIIPASEFLKPSTPSKKDLHEALSKVGEELSQHRARLEALESKNRTPQPIPFKPHFDEVTEGLPERWCIKITEENKAVLHKWRVEKLSTNGFSTNAIGWYVNYLGNAWNVVKEGYTEITFETFKKYVLKEEVKEAIELADEWYWLNDALVYVSGNKIQYGFDSDKNWLNAEERLLPRMTPATESEVFEALKAEAEKRGFKEGVKYNPLTEINGVTEVINEEYSINKKFEFFLTNGSFLARGFQYIFINGQWASIIPQPEAIDFSKAGQLVKHYNSDMIVLTTGKEHRGMFSGVKVYDPYNLSYVGEYSDVWEAKMWKSTTNSVTLKNE